MTPVTDKTSPTGKTPGSDKTSPRDKIPKTTFESDETRVLRARLYGIFHQTLGQESFIKRKTDV